MADFDKYALKVLNAEGGYTDNPNDRGGCTKWGITIDDWKRYGTDVNKDGTVNCEDVKRIVIPDAYWIFKHQYWDLVHGDDIISQSVAEFITDWAINSGTVTAVKRVQRMLDLKDDGVIGPITLKYINNSNAETLFTRLQATREAFYYAIVKRDPSQKIFLNGWINRNNSFKFHG